MPTRTKKPTEAEKRKTPDIATLIKQSNDVNQRIKKELQGKGQTAGGPGQTG